MRILNLGVDTLFVKGNQKEDTEIKGVDKCNIEFILGEPLYDVINTKTITETIPNYVLFGGENGFTVGSDKLLTKSNYLLTVNQENIPYVMDKCMRVVGNFNLLFTSTYNLDFTSIASELKLYARDSNYFRRIKIIAGGYENLGGKRHLTLLLLVPKEVKFVNHGDIQETLKDKIIKKVYKHSRTIQEVMSINEYKIMT